MAPAVGLPDASAMSGPAVVLVSFLVWLCCQIVCCRIFFKAMRRSRSCCVGTPVTVLVIAMSLGAAFEELNQANNGDPYKAAMDLASRVDPVEAYKDRPPPSAATGKGPAEPAIKEGFLEFPKDFVWGAATAAYQIEGAAAEGGRTPSIWDQITHAQILKRMGINFQSGDIADDHYHRFRDDVALMAKLNLKAYRLSISWSRVIPDGDDGPVNEEGIKFYNDLFDELAKYNIDPWVTLFHWDLPTAINDKFGGLLGPKEKIVNAYTRYAQVCFQRFGDRVKHWITFNEPFVVAFYYMPGIGWPMRYFGPAMDPYTAAHNMLLCHGHAVDMYRRQYKAKQKGVIGITLNADHTVPYNPDNAQEVAAAQRARDFQLGWFADPIYFGDYPATMREAVGWRLPTFTPEETVLLKGSSEFFGLNNYFTTHAFPIPESQQGKLWWKFFKWCCDIQGAYAADREVITKDDPEWEKVSTGTMWPIVPWGFRDLMLYVQERYSPPGGIAITENGCSYEEEQSAYNDKNDPAALEPQLYKPGTVVEDWDNETFNDPRRVRFFRHHLAAVHAARHGGADVRAYFAWSLMDNFEWLAGYRMRFGIVRVEYPTQKRIVKASGRFYASIINNSGFEAAPKSDQYPGRPWPPGK